MNPLRSYRTSIHQVIRNMLLPSGVVRWRQLCYIGVGVSVGWVGGALGQPWLPPTRPGIPTAVLTADTVAGATRRASRTPSNVPASWMSDTADTGDYASGHRSFARYTTALLCVEAARTEAAYARRTAVLAAAAYTLQYTAPERDTLPARDIRVARTCGARFLDQPVSRMAAADLPALFELALFARQDTLAQAILARSAELAPTDTARQHVWLDGLDTLLHAEPARVAAAMALVTQWNRLGRSAVVLQVRSALRLLAFWQDHFDRARMREVAETLLRSDPDPTQPVATKIALLNGHVTAYGALWQLTALDQPDSLAVMGQRVVRDLQRPVWEMPGWQQIPIKWVREFQAARHDAEALRAFAMEKSDAFRDLRVDGQPMPPLTVDDWMTPPGVTQRDTVQPIPGRISLFVRLNVECYNEALWQFWGTNACTWAVNRLARWQRLYAGAGLQLTVVGYTRQSVLYSGPLASAAQAAPIAWYVQQFAHVPVTVAVQRLKVTRLPVPDGTLVYGFTETIDQMFGERNISSIPLSLAVLTDRAGRAVYVGPDNTVLLDVLLAHLLAVPSSTPGTTSPVSPLTPVTSVTPATP